MFMDEGKEEKKVPDTFNSPTMKDLVVSILRWLAVLPGSILFVIVCMFPIHWFVELKKYAPVKIIEFDNPAQFEYLLYAFCNPLFFNNSCRFHRT